jgi:Xaa-Pro aminopeptidase
MRQNRAGTQRGIEFILRTCVCGPESVVVACLPMKAKICVLLLFLSTAATLHAADSGELRERRQRAAAAFHDGILLIHANLAPNFYADGFRQDPAFYYFTGLENTQGALLAIDGRSGESWLFLPSTTGFSFSKILPPEVSATPEAAKKLEIEHIVDWSELENFLAQRATSPTILYFPSTSPDVAELPSNISGENHAEIPLWAITIAKKWPSSFQLKNVRGPVFALMAVQSPSEIAASRAAAKATVPAVMAGIHAIKPGVSQRSVEAAVENACWRAGARGPSFWPWAMSGENSVFPRPFASETRYDHLNSTMHPGDLVRLDVGCEWDHYQGDLGRTIPVSGHFTDDQRETWNIFVAAYQAGVKSLREGLTANQVFEIWSAELLRHRESAKTALAQSAIDTWSKRENVPFWQLHTINLDAGYVDGSLRAGTTIAFEPIASLQGQGYYLEDMFLITKDGAELLTPGVPYTAEEIEAAMR